MCDNGGYSQKIPIRKHKFNFPLVKENDINKYNELSFNFYSSLDKFYNDNMSKLNKDINKAKFSFELQENNFFLIKDYDHNILGPYGTKKDKFLYLTDIEIFYLYQIGLVKPPENFSIDELFSKCDLNRLHLYCYLKRSGKMVKCFPCDSENEKYFLVSENLDSHRKGKFSEIIHIINKKNISFAELTAINDKMKNFSKDLKESPLFILAFIDKINITFISLNMNNKLI